MISIIIPTRDERDLLPATLEAVRQNQPKHEVIVVDAGSTDETIYIAEQAGVRVVRSPIAQRASQLNLGAREAGGEILLFLHADTILPQSALLQITRVLGNPRIGGGGFARRFHPTSIWLNLTCWLADQRCRYAGWFLGDQAIFARRIAFESLGGFRELPVFEDLDFSRRLAKITKLTMLTPPVISSARRFRAHGPILTTCRDFWLTIRFLTGVNSKVRHGQIKSEREGCS